MAATVDTSAFTITELSGKKRSVRLTARALPYRPLEFVDTQRVELTWYPGSPEASANVLGAALEGTSINGYWKDMYIAQVPGSTQSPALLDNSPVTDADALVRLFRSISREGQQLEVTWATHVRQGFLRSFKHTWHNIHDVEWTMEFAWVNDGSTIAPAAFQQSSTSSNAASQLEVERAALVNATVPPLLLPIIGLFLSAVVSNVQRLSDAVQQASDAVANLALQAITPNETARRVVATSNEVVASTDVFVDEIDSTPFRARVFNALPAELGVGQILRGERYQRVLRQSAQAMKRTAIEASATIGKSLSPDLLATYRPKGHEDLRDVSRKFYGTPFEWQRLLSYNLLDSSECFVGQVLLVPKLDSEVRQ